MVMSLALLEALAWAAEQREAMVELLRRLVDVNSYSGNPRGIAEVGRIVGSELAAARGLSSSLIEGDAPQGPHLVAKTSAPGARVLLVGHLDTVFPPGSFEGYRERSDVAFGPGVYDMKGGLVVITYALRALSEVGLLPSIALAFVAVSDEEIGSPSGRKILAKVAAEAGASCGLVFESGRAADEIVTQRKGIAFADVVATGKPAHAGNAHAQGKNAIWALARFVDAAQQLTNYGAGVTVNVGRIEGGEAANTVPASAKAVLDLRFERADDAEALFVALSAAAKTAAASVEGTQVEVTVRPLRAALERTPASQALLAKYALCATEAGLGGGEAPLQGGASDANTLAELGIPAIDGLGPRGSGFHTPEERMELTSLIPKTEALIRFLSTFAQGDRPAAS